MSFNRRPWEGSKPSFTDPRMRPNTNNNRNSNPSHNYAPQQQQAYYQPPTNTYTNPNPNPNLNTNNYQSLHAHPTPNNYSSIPHQTHPSSLHSHQHPPSSIMRHPPKNMNNRPLNNMFTDMNNDSYMNTNSNQFPKRAQAILPSDFLLRLQNRNSEQPDIGQQNTSTINNNRTPAVLPSFVNVSKYSSSNTTVVNDNHSLTHNNRTWSTVNANQPRNNVNNHGYNNNNYRVMHTQNTNMPINAHVQQQQSYNMSDGRYEHPKKQEWTHSHFIHNTRIADVNMNQQPSHSYPIQNRQMIHQPSYPINQNTNYMMSNQRPMIYNTNQQKYNTNNNRYNSNHRNSNQWNDRSYDSRTHGRRNVRNNDRNRSKNRGRNRNRSRSRDYRYNDGRRRNTMDSHHSSHRSHSSVIGLSKTNVYLNGIPRTWNKERITKEYERYGPILSINLWTDHSTGHSRGSCFIDFEYAVDAKKCISGMEGVQYRNCKPLITKYADIHNERNYRHKYGNKSRNEGHARSRSHSRVKYRSKSDHKSPEKRSYEEKRKSPSRRHVRKKVKEVKSDFVIKSEEREDKKELSEDNISKDVLEDESDHEKSVEIDEESDDLLRIPKLIDMSEDEDDKGDEDGKDDSEDENVKKDLDKIAKNRKKAQRKK